MDSLKQNLENNFSGVESLGFSSPIKFVGNAVAVGIRKDFDDGSISGMKIGILKPTKEDVEPLYISVTHGKKTNTGIEVRGHVKLTEPINLYSSPNTGERFFSTRSLYLKDDFYYDKTRDVFLKNSQEISACDIVTEVFEKHVRTTRPIRGTLLRMRLWFWQLALPWVFNRILYNLFHYVLLLVSGHRYIHTFKEKVETKKGFGIVPINEWGNRHAVEKQSNVGESKSETMDIFKYKLSKHSAFTYSLFSLILYLYYSFCHGHMPAIIEVISNSTVATLFYLIVTLHLYDKGLPLVLRFGVDTAVKAAHHFAYKSIAV